MIVEMVGVRKNSEVDMEVTIRMNIRVDIRVDYKGSIGLYPMGNLENCSGLLQNRSDFKR